MAKIYATGKRKSSIAKVWIKSGSGKMSINGLSLDEWLGGHEAIKKRVLQPLFLIFHSFHKLCLLATSHLVMGKL